MVLPEFASIDAFAEFLFDDERSSYSHVELTTLMASVRQSSSVVRKALLSYGLVLEPRQKEKHIRGVSSSDNDRWFGPGSCKTHGGSGINPQTGVADNLSRFG